MRREPLFSSVKRRTVISNTVLAPEQVPFRTVESIGVGYKVPASATAYDENPAYLVGGKVSLVALNVRVTEV
jgi:hypothetical protein